MKPRAAKGTLGPPDLAGISAADLQRDEEAALALYQFLRHKGEARIGEISGVAGLDEVQSARGWNYLRELGLVQVVGTKVQPVDPDAAMVLAMDTYHDNTARQLHDAQSLRLMTESLMTVFRPAVARESADIAVERLGDGARKSRMLIDLNASLRESADSIHPGPMPPMETLEQSLAEDEKLIGRGVRVRVLYPVALLRSPKYTRYLHRVVGLGVETRLLDHSPFDMLIFDRHTACLPGDPDRASESMLLIRGSSLLKPYMALFEDCWLRGTPVALEAASRAGDAAEVNEQERTVIRLMSSGLSDDQIARKLGVHRRTVQRAVAKLMEQLNATSRFEAGLKLARDPALTKVYTLD